MINLGELRAKITVATSEAMGDVEKFQDKLSATADILTEVGGRLSKMGALGVGAIGYLASKGAEWNAQVAGTDFLFKNLDATVQQSINSNMKNAEAIGLTVQQYKDGATNISTYYKNMGLTSKEIANMSDKTIQLVADLGAVVDMPFDEALARFKSGLMGNYEALDVFGISISASSLENSEFVKGLGKTWKQLSDNEKMLAVYNEIQRQGASATGLAKQEATQFAMQMKLLKQELRETVGAIGEKLLPILQPFVEKLRDIVKGIREWVEEHPKLTGVILAVIGAISALNLVTGALILTIGSCITTFLFWKTVLTPIGLFLKSNLIAGLISATLNLSIFKMGLMGAITSLATFVGRIPLISVAMAGLSRGIAFVTTALMGLTPLGALGLVMKGFRLFSMVMLLTGGDLDGFVQKLVNVVQNGLNFLLDNLPQWIEAGKELITSLIRGIAENLPQIMEKAGEILKALAEGLVASIGVLIEVGGQLIQGLIQGIVTGLPMLIEGGQKLLEMFVMGILYGLPILLNVATMLVNSFTVWVETQMPAIITKGVDIIVRLIEGITLAIPMIVEVAVQIINALAQGFATYFPLILQAGVNILIKLIEGIITALPIMLQAGINIINGLINSIISFLPLLLDTGIKILTTLIDGIVTMLPMLIEVGLKLLTTLINAVIQNLPRLIELGIKLITTLVNAIIQNLPKIIEAGVKILTTLVNGIIKMLPQLIEAGIRLITTLVTTIIQNLPRIIQAGGQILKALVDGVLQLIGALIQAGIKLVVELAKAVVSNAPKMLKAGKDLVKAVIDGLKSLAGALLDAGKNIVTSILNGIKGAWGSITSFISSGLSKLNPFKGKGRMVVGVEGSVDEGGIARLNELARNGISSKPSHFGFAPRQGLFNLNVPEVSSPKLPSIKEMAGEAKEFVFNTVVELDGYQVAKASARYMQDELLNMERKASRLGGVL